MNARRRSLTVAALTVSAAIVGIVSSSVRAQAEPATVAAPNPPHALIDDHGGWTPPAALLDRAAALATLDAANAVRRIAALARESARLPVDVCRAGLRFAQRTAAFRCAVHLEWDHLDAWESARVVDLCVREVARPKTRVDFDRYRYIAGGADLEAFCDGFPNAPWAEPAAHYFANLHRQIHARHFPMLCGFANRRADVREEVLDQFGVVLPRTNRHRRVVAATFLGRGVPGPAPTGPGLDPLLVALIRDRWLAGSDPSADGWEIRWLRQSTPAASDASLLLAVARGACRRQEDATLVAIRAMRHLGDAATEAYLRAMATQPDQADAYDRTGTAPLVAAAAVAMRTGDATARARLARQASECAWALGLWLEVDPAAAVADLRARILGPDAKQAFAALERMRDVEHLVRRSLRLVIPDDAFRGFERAAIASGVGGLRLARIGTTIPGCNTAALAREACARLPQDRARLNDPDDTDLRSDVGFLEAAAPDALRTVLRAIAAADDAGARIALPWLLTMGDAASGARLVRWIEETGDDETEEPFVALARSRCPDVRAFLERRARDAMAAETPDEAWTPLVALGVYHGLPEHGPSPDFDDAETSTALVAAYRDALLAADPERALAVLFAAPLGSVAIGSEAWRHGSKPMREWLHRLRARRDLRLYAYATAQLAAMGDADARAETLRVMRAGRYLWVHDVLEDASLATLGHDLRATIPLWIDELESNCCQRVIASNVFESTFGMDNPALDSEGVTEIPADCMRRWWTRHKRATFRESKIAGALIPYIP